MNEAGTVMTVTGRIPASRLGFCQCHEHIMLRPGVPSEINPALEAGDVEKSRREVEDYRTSGGNSLVDAQPIGCGRMPAQLAEIARTTGVNVIASTGFHLQRFYPARHWIHTISEGRLEEVFVHELTVGMYDNADRALVGRYLPIRAGIVKAACESGSLTRNSRRLFAAAARAAVFCGVSVMIHTEQGCSPLEVFDFLCGLGLPPQRMLFCHMDRTMARQDVVRQLCREGAFAEHDTIGRPKYHSDEAEIRLILELLDAGLDRQLLLSLDTTNQRMLNYGGSIGLSYLKNTFLPRLEQAGVSPAAIRTITCENPARALGR